MREDMSRDDGPRGRKAALKRRKGSAEFAMMIPWRAAAIHTGPGLGAPTLMAAVGGQEAALTDLTDGSGRVQLGRLARSPGAPKS